MASSPEFEDLGLSILGLGTEYPPHSLKPNSLEVLSKRFYPESPAMKKVLSINRYTGIDQRSSIGTPDHPLVNQPDPPTIAELHDAFMTYGIPLAVTAARKALGEAHVDAVQVTHMVSTTCTNSANPGYDHFVADKLGLSPTTEKVLLHGVGCSGGLAALRTAANLCLGHTARRRPARILVVALEISTTLVRSELESINALQETRIGVALFSDCAGALVLSNNIPYPAPAPPPAPPIYQLLGWHHHTIPHTESDLGFDVDPLGWKVILSPRVPSLTQSVLESTFDNLLASLPPLLPQPQHQLHSKQKPLPRDGDGVTDLGSTDDKTSVPSSAPLQRAYRAPHDFDWAMHPGGATILTGAERALGITPRHMRASYDTYVRHGNSSSATILSVLDRLRGRDMDEMAPPLSSPDESDGGKDQGEDAEGTVRDYVVGCAFGPGISVEMCMLKRVLGGGGGGGGMAGLRPGTETPPETESEGGGASEDGDGDEHSSEGGEEAGVQESLDVRSQQDGEAFISEALEGVELD